EGEIRITAHEAANALVITSSLHDYAALRGVIEKLDAPKKQVFIEAVVMEMNIDQSRKLGLGFHGGIPNIPTHDSITVLGFQAGPTAVPPGAFIQKPDLLTSLALGVRGPAIENSQQLLGASVPSFGVLITAIATSSDTNVLSTPPLIATDNVEAEINVGA